jgi:hypothetical protein
MAERMIGIKVLVTRYISDEPQPGIVECEFADARGRRWRFIEKSAVISSTPLDGETVYPQPGIIGCEIIGRSRDAVGRELILVDTERPWGVASVEGSMRFEVRPDTLWSRAEVDRARRPV